MKKFFIFIFFLLFFGESFSEKIDDYSLFLNGKNAYFKKNYSVAKQNFETLLKTFSKSNVFLNNYAYFYIGMNYYKLEDYHKAAFYLEKAVYSTDTFSNNNKRAENIHFFAERDYSLGDSLLKIGETDKGITYLKRVNYNNYYPFVAYYERNALKILGNFDEIYEKKLQLKFLYNFDFINSFSVNELLEIGSFYHSKKVYDREEEFYKKILENISLTTLEKEKITNAYLEVLLTNNKEKEILNFTANVSEPQLKNLYNYYRGLAFYQMKDFSRALYLLNNIKDEKYYSKANYYIAGIYFALADYNETLTALKKVEEKNIITDCMAAFSYYYLGDEQNTKNAVNSMIKKYPNAYAGLYFNYLSSTTDKIYLNSLDNLLKFSTSLLDNAQETPETFLKKGDILEIEQLSQVAKLGDRELLKTILKKSIFYKKETPEAAMAITTILENGKFYELAFKNSSDHMSEFSKYKELFKYNFPLYYSEIIDPIAKKYDAPQELIYTIIHDISGFNPYYISDDSKFGIMDIPYDENNNLEFFELFNIEKNIEEGTKILKNYLIKYQGNKIKALIAYVYGEEYLNNLYFEYNNDINLSSIIIPEERFFLQNILMTYILYSRLYDFN